MKIIGKRIEPGYYEIQTPRGLFYLEYTEVQGASDDGVERRWLIYSPDQDKPDTHRPTKKRAIEYIQFLCLGS